MPQQNVRHEQSAFSVVILGDFNPAIFHPLWFAQQGLIASEEVEAVSDLETNENVSRFLLNDVHFQVERHRFGLTTKNPARAIFLRDLAVGAFTVLEYTPLNAVGLNKDMVFSMGGLGSWHGVGDCFAPKQPWQGILESPGMLNVTMGGKRAECSADSVIVSIRPFMGIDNGVLVAVNQQYNLKTTDTISTAQRNSRALQILSEDWTPFLAFAEDSAVTLLANTTAREGCAS
ncbi:MAG: hypothetical protein ACKOEO_10825 [Planctomycetaceae bacterium]